MNQQPSSSISLPVVPVRDKVVFPNIQTPLVVGRQKSIEAVKRAQLTTNRIFITAQRHVKVEDPMRDDLFATGTIADIQQVVNMPEGIVRLRVIGLSRGKLLDVSIQNGCLMGDIQMIDTPSLAKENGLEMEAMRRMILKKFDDYVKKMGRVPADVLNMANQTTAMDTLADLISDAILISVEEKQDLLELIEVPKRLGRLVEILDAEIEILNIEKKIQNRVHKQIEKNQKEYYLNEQMRAIQKELKKKDDSGVETDDLKVKIKEAKMPAETEEIALKEADRLEKMMPFSPEATVVRGYIDWLINLPWAVMSDDQMDVKDAKAILDDDHFGLEKPKERLLEYLAVMKLKKTISGPILCFVGPPGVGKTSVAKSLARALGRQFARISLGGVHDESEIRGHRRTYIGSLPGRIIQALKKVKTKNPVILLDEIDKMGTDWRGDPSAALLEVLDPEQNKTFTDHYLDVGFDLSHVIFIATANSLYNIPSTLLDRLEIIRFSAYTTDEKAAIARRFLFPKELKAHGLAEDAITITDEALRKIIHIYTQEAGVRDLGRKIAQLCRKVAVEVVRRAEDKKKGKAVEIGLQDLGHYLGVPEHVREKITMNSVGIATGLAWTEHGGETLTIEVSTVPGQGKVQLTGKLGTVMLESAQTALSLVKSRSQKFRISDKIFKKSDIHLHIPEGAVPKDGPSAGIALATAMLSSFTTRAVTKDLAMTGEVTLRGRVLPIGGLKEKVLAAYREGVKVILFPRGNEKDLPEIPENVRKSLKLVPVYNIDDVFQHALQPGAPRSGPLSRKSTTQLHPN
jgi:ATP-dependent Lon protease